MFAPKMSGEDCPSFFPFRMLFGIDFQTYSFLETVKRTTRRQSRTPKPKKSEGGSLTKKFEAATLTVGSFRAGFSFEIQLDPDIL